MINLEDFTSFVEDNFDLISGVPCSYFKDFLNHLDKKEGKSKIKHIIATREDEAIAIASGVALSNKYAIIYMQNSGLGNIGDALTSLAQLYKLPMLILISYRGLKDDEDFPEHSIMGKINNSFLEALNLKCWLLESKNWQWVMEKSIEEMKQDSLPVVLLVKKGILCE